MSLLFKIVFMFYRDNVCSESFEIILAIRLSKMILFFKELIKYLHIITSKILKNSFKFLLLIIVPFENQNS